MDILRIFEIATPPRRDDLTQARHADSRTGRSSACTVAFMSHHRGVDRCWLADTDDPADLARETPATEMRPATITITDVELDEDLWTAVWQHGTEHRDAYGSLAKMISWARKQPADIWFLFDIEACDYVTVLPGSLGSA